MVERRSIIWLIVPLLLLIVGIASAQQNPSSGLTSNDEALQCTIEVRRSEPSVITAGEAAVLTVRGEGFTEDSVVRLPSYGVLSTTYINSQVITAELPANLPGAFYEVKVVNPGCVISHNTNNLKLTILNAPMPTATFADFDVPTPFPGAPSLVARNFSTSPQTIPPGGTVTLLFDVFNQGNRTAEGVSASLDSGGSFLPAGGQLTTVLSDVLPGGTVTVALTAVAAQNAEPGPASIPITINYRDFNGEAYSSKATLSVNIERVVESTQLVLSRYQISPDPVLPGEPATVQVTVNNIGNTTAFQALLRVSGDGVLLAGQQGDSFPLADLLPGAATTLDLPLIVKPDAKAGPQSQPFTITYLLNGEVKSIDGTMTIHVASVVEKSPVMLVDAYEINKEPLRPGEQFELDVDLKNVGDVTAIGMLVTFGTVETSGDPDNGGSGGSSTSTTPSTTFAPLGTGGTIFIGDVPAGDITTFKQSFIVGGTVTSGVYSLPITLRYQKPDGTSAQDNLRASVVVIKPPTLRVVLQSPPPEFAMMGEPITLVYDLVNNSTSSVLQLTNATTEAENGEVVDGADVFIGQISANDQSTYGSTIIPSEEGTMTITATIRYLDDLNNEREIVETFEVEVSAPPPPPDIEPTPDLLPFPTSEPTPESNNDVLGRLLLGLLGLGS